MSDLIRQFLESKDHDNTKYIPKAYSLAQDEKQRTFHMRTSKLRFELEGSAKCIPKCFKILNTPVMTEGESECMINCIGKRMEVLTSYSGKLAGL